MNHEKYWNKKSEVEWTCNQARKVTIDEVHTRLDEKLNQQLRTKLLKVTRENEVFSFYYKRVSYNITHVAYDSLCR